MVRLLQQKNVEEEEEFVGCEEVVAAVCLEISSSSKIDDVGVRPECVDP